MILIILAGIGVGSGFVLVLRGLFPAPLTLQAALDNLSGIRSDLSLDGFGEASSERAGSARRFAARALEVNVARVPRLAEIVIPDLAITGTPPETFAIKVVGYAVAMALMVPLLAVAATTAGIQVGIEVPLLGVLVLGVGGAAMPFIDLHTAAERRRRHFLHSLATYASLVSMAMAGSMGWSSALEAASSVSTTDWAMDEIAQALLWSQAYHRPPWEGLDRLAERFALSDLSDLARSMAQAGEGARIRDTLEAKASSLRLSETTALEHDAQAVTQKMLLPGVLLMAGYGVLIFYPALASFTGSHL
jgi:tight adherence protein C